MKHVGIKQARQLLGSLDSSLRTLDALHLAAAMAETITIMTADRDLAKAAKRHKVGAVLVS
jgi:predicted nucleic acid-binding protein